MGDRGIIGRRNDKHDDREREPRAPSRDGATSSQSTMLQLQRVAGNGAVNALLRTGDTTIRRDKDGTKGKGKGGGGEQPTEEEQQKKQQETDELAQFYSELTKDNDPDFVWTTMRGRKPELQLAVMYRLTSRGEATALLADKSWRGSFFYPWVDRQGRGGALDEKTRAVLSFIAEHVPDDALLLEACVEHLFDVRLSRLQTKVPPDGAAVRRLLKELSPVAPGDQAAHLMIWTLVEWIRSKGGATQAYATYGELPAAKQDVAMTRILDDQAAAQVFGAAPYTINFHPPLLESLPKAKNLTDVQKRFMKVAFFAKSTDLNAMRRIFEQRFALKLGETDDGSGSAWDAPGLLRMYPALDALPPAHVERNKSLIEMNRYAPGGGIEGWYSEKNKESAIGYQDGADIDNKTENTAGDPLHGKNTFDTTIRHEVGHAVDAQLGWSKSKAIQEDRFGGWIEYGTSKSAYLQVVGDMVEKSGAGLAALPSKAKKAAIKDLAKSAYADDLSNIDNVRAWMKDAIDEAGAWDGLSAGEQNAALNDPAIVALHEGRTDNDPWYEPGGGSALNGYLYERSYGFTGWYRYDESARARKVSEYQFRHPGEWFAEAYAAYYCPVGQDEERGAVLAQSDPATKQWFDTKVHPMKVSR